MKPPSGCSKARATEPDIDHRKSRCDDCTLWPPSISFYMSLGPPVQLPIPFDLRPFILFSVLSYSSQSSFLIHSPSSPQQHPTHNLTKRRPTATKPSSPSQEPAHLLYRSLSPTPTPQDTGALLPQPLRPPHHQQTCPHAPAPAPPGSANPFPQSPPQAPVRQQEHAPTSRQRARSSRAVSAHEVSGYHSRSLPWSALSLIGGMRL